MFIFPDELKEQDKKKWKPSLIPAIGQIKNKKYLKAGVLAFAQSYSVYKSLEYHGDDKISKRNTYAWWFLGLYFYGIIDSYVDYNLKNFPNESDNESDNKKKE